MSEKNVLYGVLGLILGILVTWVFISLAVNSGSVGMTNMMGVGGMMMDQGDRIGHGLVGKTGDEFDQAFTSEMIEHHQGAIEMADLAATNAKHQELKDIAKDIISQQQQEIEQLREWRRNWFGSER